MKINLENMNMLMYQKIDSLINADILHEKQIVIFGLNSSSYGAKEYLEYRGYKTYAYIDNDEKKRIEYNKTAVEIKAYPPEGLLQKYCKNTIVLIASKYFEPMSAQLEKMGYLVNKQIYQIADFYSLDSILKNVGEPQLPVMSDSEVKKSQLKMLNYIKKICEANQLRYYLCGGTLIGAIRHKGYIPWDDDIDIIMPMPDYKKFLELVKKDDKYEALSIYTHPDEYYLFAAKLLDRSTLALNWEFPLLSTTGVFIDIFPTSGLPDNAEDRKEFYIKVKNLHTEFTKTYVDYNCDSEKICLRRKKLRSDIITMMEQYDYESSEYIGWLFSRYKDKELMPREIYNSSIPVLFEGEYYSAAIGYDDYLMRIHGDYMSFPPVKDRKSLHNCKFYQMEAGADK